MPSILLITALYPPTVGGAATYFGDIAPALARRDDIDQLIVLTERMAGEPAHTQTGALHVLRRLPTRVSGSRRPWPIHAVTYVLTQLWFTLYLPRLVEQHDIDLIHYHTRYRGRLFYDALGRSGVPVLADLRDKMIDPSSLTFVTDRLLCCAEGVQHFAVENGFPAKRTDLIPIPFTPPAPPAPATAANVRRQYVGDDASQYLLFLGDITRNKGVYDLLSAYEEWQKRHPTVKLIFAGTNREGDTFRSAVRETAGASYLGLVPHTDALALMRGADIVVLPSRSEGLPRVILEALSMRTKVISPPNIPEFERHIPETVLPTVTPHAIRETLDRMWQEASPPSYPFEQHNVQVVVEQLHNTYTELVTSQTTNERAKI